MTKDFFHSLSVKDSLESLESSGKGLSNEEASTRLLKHGKNRLKETNSCSVFRIISNQFKSTLVIILLIAMLLSILLKEHIDAIAIGVVIVLNAVLGFIEEYKAEKSIDELKKLETLQAVVLREGEEKYIEAENLVKGDIILLSEGEKIPADCRILESISLEIDESMLTGESMPVSKTVDKLQKDLAIQDRKNMAYSSCLITKGKAKALVVATGMNTEIGQIATQIQDVKEELTPLQKTLDNLGKKIALIALLLSLPVLLISWLRGGDLFETLMMGVSLAVSSIPEGLPIVVTVALALGVKRMVKSNVLTKKLPAVESLGGVDVICSDKTGTITRNQMEVVDLFMLDFSASELALESVLCSDAKEDHGDPTEIALLNFLKKYKKQNKSVESFKRIGEIPFSSENKYMAVSVKNGDRKAKAIIKGAPEIVLNFCKVNEKDKEKILKANEEFTKNGLRVLAVITKTIDKDKELFALKNYTFSGLLALQDPPREQVAASIKKCQKAGVRVIMITGDHKNTAMAVAREVGLDARRALIGLEIDELNQEELIEELKTCSVFARVSPQNKVQILEALQSQGKQVAMTGDGVNDAPALRKADIGMAVGSGTALSRDVADMVLLNDDFSSIVEGIEEGRHIFFNIKKFVRFLLSANFDEILCIGASILMGLPLPFIPIQILWLNLVTDSFPALALSNDVGDPTLMEQKPYVAKKEVMHGILSYAAVAGLFGFLITFSTFVFMFKYVGVSQEYARTMSFSAMVFFELFLVFSVRAEHGAIKFGLFSNKFLLLSVAFAFVLQFLAVYNPLFQNFLGTVNIGWSDMLWLLLWSSGGFVFMEVYKKISKVH